MEYETEICSKKNELKNILHIRTRPTKNSKADKLECFELILQYICSILDFIPTFSFNLKLI